MAIYLKKFSTTAEYEAYIASEDKVLPNVSICEDAQGVHYNPFVSVNSVSLNKNELSLGKGATETLVATVLPSNASNKNLTWSSSDDNVATVDSNGLVTAVGGGNANITVTTVDGGHTAQCEINVIVNVNSVSLNKNELSLDKGATETLVATVLPSDASNKSITWSSSDDNVATVDSNGLVTAVGNIGDNANITVTTVDGGHTAQCAFNIIDPYNGHDYVEIGGLKWATMNIGATAVTDTGLYFQWGDAQGYTAAQVGSGSGKKYFGWADYKYGNGTADPGATGMTKYNSTDGKKVLDASDDAAQAAWGGSWRMPTTAEFVALGAAIDYIDADGNTITGKDKRTTLSGVTGLYVADKTDRSKRLFFPAAGYCNNGSVYDVGSHGYYWSSSVDSSGVQYPYSLYFSSSRENWQRDGYGRYNGFAVRGVVG